MIEVTPYKRGFAVYEDGVLLTVCSYRRGAETVKDRLTQLRLRVQHLEATCEPPISEAAPCENR